MSNSVSALDILVYDATLTFSHWATLSLSVAADNGVSGIFIYLGTTTELTGTKNPGSDGSQENYVLDGGEVSMRISSYPAFGAQFPVAGVASISEAGPFYLIGKRS
ncbi:MAG TPA: hypothetical protein VK582_11550 [Pyrinomonadaceae bacterium]|nr:hypothetical protein [Pyrinomonadaceae bacterium]